MQIVQPCTTVHRLIKRTVGWVRFIYIKLETLCDSLFDADQNEVRHRAKLLKGVLNDTCQSCRISTEKT